MRYLSTILTVLACSMTLAHPASAQNAAQSVTDPVVLAPEPVSVGNLGMSLLLPEEAAVQTEEIPGGIVKMIIQPSDGTWVLQIYNSRSRNLELTPREALDAIVSQRLREGPRGQHPSTGRVVSVLKAIDTIDDLAIKTVNEGSELRAARAYIVDQRFGHTEESNSDDIFPPTGYTVLRTAPGEFITLQLDCVPEHFARARQTYETIIASAQATDPDEAARIRAFALSAGEVFLKGVTRSDLDDLMDGETRWFRIYEPATTGSPSDAKEIGYQRLEVRLGQLGELDPSKQKHEWTTDERTYGYLVTLEARTLNTPTASARRGEVISHSDVGARFFLSRDRSEEFWNITLDIRVDGKVERVFQNLIRRNSRVSISTRRQGQLRENAEYDVVSKHYLSAVERVLLPQLVAARAKNDTGAVFNLGFYTFDSTRSTIAFRSERFERTPGGGWQQTTVPYKGALPWTTTLDRDGHLVTQALPPARTIERIELDELHRLWTSKGLPTG